MSGEKTKKIIHTFLSGTIIFGSFFASLAATEHLLKKISGDSGLVLSLSMGASSLIAIGMTILILEKTGKHPRELLGFHPIYLNETLKWLIVSMAIVIIYDVLAFTFNYPILPETVKNIFDTTRHHFVFAITFVFIVPFFEELFFRGFLLNSMSEFTADDRGPIVLSAFIWAVNHTQYGIYETGVIFITGILLGITRIKTGSIYTCYFMHVSINLITTIELFVLE